jgi:hypothetical protein
MADYYGMVRPLSATLVGSVVQVAGLQDHAWEVLPYAVNLRNEKLYKDCVIPCLGPRKNPQDQKIINKDLRATVRAIAIEQSKKVSGFTQQTKKFYADLARHVQVQGDVEFMHAMYCKLEAIYWGDFLEGVLENRLYVSSTRQSREWPVRGLLRQPMCGNQGTLG